MQRYGKILKRPRSEGKFNIFFHITPHTVKSVLNQSQNLRISQKTITFAVPGFKESELFSYGNEKGAHHLIDAPLNGFVVLLSLFDYLS